jgi:hypothetical protein
MATGRVGATVCRQVTATLKLAVVLAEAMKGAGLRVQVQSELDVYLVGSLCRSTKPGNDCLRRWFHAFDSLLECEPRAVP